MSLPTSPHAISWHAGRSGPYDLVGFQVAAAIIAKRRDVDTWDRSMTATAEIGVGGKLAARYSARPSAPKTPLTQQVIIVQGMYASMQCFLMLLVSSFPVALIWIQHHSPHPSFVALFRSSTSDSAAWSRCSQSLELRFVCDLRVHQAFPSHLRPRLQQQISVR